MIEISCIFVNPYKSQLVHYCIGPLTSVVDLSNQYLGKLGGVANESTVEILYKLATVQDRWTSHRYMIIPLTVLDFILSYTVLTVK